MVILTGCATRTEMALKDDGDVIKSDSKPLYLMTATIRNIHKPRYQPKLLVVHIARDGGEEVATRLNFTMDDKARAETDSPADGSTYFLRMALDPGNYEIQGMTSMGRAFPLTGFFSTPIYTDLKVGERGVYYLGHIEASVRARVGNEFRAGPMIPLLDQAITGASDGSFDIEISDRFAQDEVSFRTKFPALKDVSIIKAVMPPFDRAKAQERWDKQ